jgi:hypothetical protein
MSSDLHRILHGLIGDMRDIGFGEDDVSGEYVPFEDNSVWLLLVERFRSTVDSALKLSKGLEDVVKTDRRTLSKQEHATMEKVIKTALCNDSAITKIAKFFFAQSFETNHADKNCTPSALQYALMCAMVASAAQRAFPAVFARSEHTPGRLKLDHDQLCGLLCTLAHINNKDADGKRSYIAPINPNLAANMKDVCAATFEEFDIKDMRNMFDKIPSTFNLDKAARVYGTSQAAENTKLIQWMESLEKAIAGRHISDKNISAFSLPTCPPIVWGEYYARRPTHDGSDDKRPFEEKTVFHDYGGDGDGGFGSGRRGGGRIGSGRGGFGSSGDGDGDGDGGSGSGRVGFGGRLGSGRDRDGEGGAFGRDRDGGDGAFGRDRDGGDGRSGRDNRSFLSSGSLPPVIPLRRQTPNISSDSSAQTQAFSSNPGAQNQFADDGEINHWMGRVKASEEALNLILLRYERLQEEFQARERDRLFIEARAQTLQEAVDSIKNELTANANDKEELARQAAESQQLLMKANADLTALERKFETSENINRQLKDETAGLWQENDKFREEMQNEMQRFEEANRLAEEQLAGMEEELAAANEIKRALRKDRELMQGELSRTAKDADRAKELERNLKTLNASLDKANNDAMGLKDRMDQARRQAAKATLEKEELQREIDNLKGELRSEQSDKEKKQGVIQRLQRELDSLKGELLSEQLDNVITKETKQDVIQQLEQEIDILKDELQSEQLDNVMTKETKQEVIQRLQQEMAELLDDVQAERFDALGTRAEKQEEIQQLKREIIMLQRDLQAEQFDNVMTKEDLTEQKAKLQETERSFNTQRQLVKALNARVAQLTKVTQTLSDELGKKEEEIRYMEVAAEQEAELMQRELRAASNQLNDMYKQRRNMEASLKQARDSRADSSELNKELEALNEKLLKKEKEQRELEINLEKARRTADAALAENQDLLDAMQDERNRNQRQLAELSRELEAARRAESSRSTNTRDANTSMSQDGKSGDLVGLGEATNPVRRGVRVSSGVQELLGITKNINAGLQESRREYEEARSRIDSRASTPERRGGNTRLQGSPNVLSGQDEGTRDVAVIPVRFSRRTRGEPADIFSGTTLPTERVQRERATSALGQGPPPTRMQLRLRSNSTQPTQPDERQTPSQLRNRRRVPAGRIERFGLPNDDEEEESNAQNSGSYTPTPERPPPVTRIREYETPTSAQLPYNLQPLDTESPQSSPRRQSPGQSQKQGRSTGSSPLQYGKTFTQPSPRANEQDQTSAAARGAYYDPGGNSPMPSPARTPQTPQEIADSPEMVALVREIAARLSTTDERGNMRKENSNINKVIVSAQKQLTLIKETQYVRSIDPKGKKGSGPATNQAQSDAFDAINADFRPVLREQPQPADRSPSDMSVSSSGSVRSTTSTGSRSIREARETAFAEQKKAATEAQAILAEARANSIARIGTRSGAPVDTIGKRKGILTFVDLLCVQELREKWQTYLANIKNPYETDRALAPEWIVSIEEKLGELYLGDVKAVPNDVQERICTHVAEETVYFIDIDKTHPTSDGYLAKHESKIRSRFETALSNPQDLKNYQDLEKYLFKIPGKKTGAMWHSTIGDKWATNKYEAAFGIIIPTLIKCLLVDEFPGTNAGNNMDYALNVYWGAINTLLCIDAELQAETSAKRKQRVCMKHLLTTRIFRILFRKYWGQYEAALAIFSKEGSLDGKSIVKCLDEGLWSLSKLSSVWSDENPDRTLIRHNARVLTLHAAIFMVDHMQAVFDESMKFDLDAIPVPDVSVQIPAFRQITKELDYFSAERRAMHTFDLSKSFEETGASVEQIKNLVKGMPEAIGVTAAIEAIKAIKATATAEAIAACKGPISVFVNRLVEFIEYTDAMLTDVYLANETTRRALAANNLLNLSLATNEETNNQANAEAFSYVLASNMEDVNGTYSTVAQQIGNSSTSSVISSMPTLLGDLFAMISFTPTLPETGTQMDAQTPRQLEDDQDEENDQDA